MKLRAFTLATLSGFILTVLPAATHDAAAYRMSGMTGPVTCSDTRGFLHQNRTTVPWYLDSAEHSAGGVYTQWHNAFRTAQGSWNNVTPAGYVLNVAGYTTASVSYNGKNTVNWLRTPHCSSCLAVTVTTFRPITLEILDSDIEFDQDYAWGTTGSGQDVQSVATHELGHSMGIAHSNLHSSPYPTMYAYYVGGTSQRSLEADDRSALNCAWGRYRPSQRSDPPGHEGPEGSEALAARGEQYGGAVEFAVRANESEPGVLLEFALSRPGEVRLQIFDVSGRVLQTVLNESRAAGEHQVRWDGRSSSGKVPAGVYFARLSTPEGTSSRKLVLTD
jgi:hypothetical protein